MGRKKLTYEEVKEYIDNEGHKLLSKEYVNNSTKLDIQCPHGHIFHPNFCNFKKGSRCPVCNNKKHTYEYVKKYIEEQGYELISKEYINNVTKIEVKCQHGHIYKVRFRDFKNRNERCPICNKNSERLKYEDVKNYIESQGYELISDTYINNCTKLKIKCPNGHIFFAKYNNFKDSNTRCSICSSNSKGEDKIKKYLETQKIKFYQQYRFEDCRDKRTLPFDFYLPNYNICIEYDGVQHFEPQDFAGKGENWAEQQLLSTKNKDEIKSNYCKNNNIKLIRISYLEFNNIEGILENKLKNQQRNFND